MLTKVYSGQPFFNGIFKITLQTPQHRSYGSGVLLAGGEYVLTAAHLFADNPTLNEIQVTNGYGVIVSAVAQVFIHPFWDNNPADYNHDLALIKLSNPLAKTSGYELYREKMKLGKPSPVLVFLAVTLFQVKILMTHSPTKLTPLMARKFKLARNCFTITMTVRHNMMQLETF